MKNLAFKKASITNNSVVIFNNKIVKESCVRKEVFKKYQKPFFRLKYIFPFFSLSKKNHILITDEWSKNYCHWLFESLSKLVKLKEISNNLILAIPSSYLKIDFVKDSLKAFGFNQKNIKKIYQKSHLKVKNLLFFPVINIGTEGYYNFLETYKVRDLLISFYQKSFRLNFGERIYISRNNPAKFSSRIVDNEDEVCQIIEKYGFKKINMENFSFIEQISIMQNTKFILASHGAGISNLIFAKKAECLIELVSESWGKTCFAYLCDKMQINYQLVSCDEVEDNIKIKQIRNIKVDCDLLEKKLKNLL
jgi:capsular polysaccharide biosynthesis protein